MYKIVGADQKEYGPISADQILQWISEGRVNGQTLARLDEGPWKPLSTFPEFTAALPMSVPPTLPPGGRAGSPLGVAPRANGMAITGFVCGLLGAIGCCGPILATLGLVFSCLGLSQIKRDPQQLTGRGLAWAGIVLSLIAYVIFVVILLTIGLEGLTKNLPKW